MSFHIIKTFSYLNKLSQFLYMENLKNISLPHTAVAATLLVLNHLDLIPCVVTDVLQNKMVKIALAAGVVATSYKSVENAVVLASILYVSLNSTVNVEEEVVEVVEEKDVVEEFNDVTGIESDPDLEPSSDPLPTQDNSAPTESIEIPETPTPSSEPETNQVVEGFSGSNDMASV